MCLTHSTLVSDALLVFCALAVYALLMLEAALCALNSSSSSSRISTITASASVGADSSDVGGVAGSLKPLANF